MSLSKEKNHQLMVKSHLLMEKNHPLKMSNLQKRKKILIKMEQL
jgi:hypothetical protein